MNRGNIFYGFSLLASLFFMHSTSLHAVPLESSDWMISGPSPEAVANGQKVAREGGNIADVTVAVGLTLAVTTPAYAALGGGGFALIKKGLQIEALDFRETAPAAAHPGFFSGRPAEASQKGGAAVGVPGYVAGLFELHRKYGKLPWSKLVQGPIHLARQGFRVGGEWVQRTEKSRDLFTATGRTVFFKKAGEAYRPGEIFRQKKLAAALREIQRRGARGFYQGPVAADIVKAVSEAGGVITVADLKNYQPIWRTPLITEFRGHRIVLMPPPSSGGVIITLALALTDLLQVDGAHPLSADEFHGLAEILKASFRYRSLLGDPQFSRGRSQEILAPTNITQIAETLRTGGWPSKVVSWPPLPEPAAAAETKSEESPETTHFSIVAQNGDAVALTVTLNGNYGSGVVTPRYGIALNNEMDDFTTKPGEPNMFGLVQGTANQIEPNKRPLSSMSPTLVLKDQELVHSLGAPGGPRIISGIYQALYRLLVRKMDLDSAIQAPRVHHQFLPDRLFIDSGRFFYETLEVLKTRGHQIEEGWQSRVFGVQRVPGPVPVLRGAFDARGEGGAG